MRAAVVVVLIGVVIVVSRAVRHPDGSAAGKIQREFSGQTMGTWYTVKAVELPVEADEDREATLRSAIEEQLEDVNAKMSTYRDDSEVSRFNQSESTTPFPVSDETLAVFSKAQQLAESSGGAFDITVGPLVNAWGFGPGERTLEGPGDDELAALRARVGFRNVEVGDAAIRKLRPDVYCDLSAIAKGYAVDRVGLALGDLGCDHYMVEVGGEVRTKGLNGDGVPWRIAIEKPDPEGRAIHRVLPLSGLAMATSGDYRNYYETEGARLSHTIDPRTGRPIAHKLASVSVVHEECAMADGFATTMMVLGPEDG